MSAVSPVVYPVMQIRPNSLLVYDQFEWPTSRPKGISKRLRQTGSKNPKSELDNLGDSIAYSGQLTKHSKKRLQKAINLLVAVALPKTAINFKTNQEFKFKVNFVTLTLPCAQGEIKDSEIKKKCLDPWFKSMRYRYKLNSYVWRAERQYNGNVHFHVTSDTYLPYDGLCEVWNNQLDKLGYIDQFEDKHGHRHPNSTDVHSVQKIKNIAAYMVKYMSKSPDEHLNEKNQRRAKKGKPPIIPDNHPFQSVNGQPRWNDPIHGKVWDCSKNLKQKIKCDMILGQEEMNTLNLVRDNFPSQVIKSDFCTFVWFKPEQFEQVISGSIRDRWMDYLNAVRDPVEFEAPPPAKLSVVPDPVIIEPPKRTCKQLTLDLKYVYLTTRN